MNKKRVVVAYAVSILFSLTLIAFAVYGVSHPVSDQSHNSTTTPVGGPRQCSVKRMFRVLFSQLITICQDLHDGLIYVGIEPYQGGIGIWFALEEWNNFLRQLNLIKIVISDFQKA